MVTRGFERPIKDFISSSLPGSLDPLQFIYCPNRSTDEAISRVLHSTLYHLDISKGNYACLLFIDFILVLNTIVPLRLVAKLGDLGLSTSLCSRVLNFLTSRPQVGKIGNWNSGSRTLNTINTTSPQGCVLSPLLDSLYTCDCTATHCTNTIVKSVDDTVVIGLISKNAETAYLEEVELPTSLKTH